MTTKCKCGGRLRRTDITRAYDPHYNRVMYSDTDSQKANWKCDTCGIIRTQGKRQPRKHSISQSGEGY